MADGHSALVRGETGGPLAWLARAGLWCASVPYGVGVAVRNAWFDRPTAAVRVSVPVVCVGNLTVGGTGKTVCVEAVARFLREQDLAVTLISRGYGSTAGPNDEALLLEENLPDVPHLQGADRVAVANTAIEELEPDILVLDDGFQHRRLHRDLDVVMIDATRPLSQEYLLPRGLLREPVSGLKRAGLAILTRCDQAGADAVTAQCHWLAKRFPTLPVCTTAHQPVDAEELRGQRVAGFCGIGNPAAFRRTLTDLGASVQDFREFQDHHAYTRDDVNGLSEWAKSQPDGTILATTQKDWVKLRIDELGGRKLVAVRVGLVFLDGEEKFETALRSVIREPLPEEA